MRFLGEKMETATATVGTPSFLGNSHIEMLFQAVVSGGTGELPVVRLGRVSESYCFAPACISETRLF